MCGRTTEHWSELFGKGRDICATFISQSNGLCTHTHTHKHYVNLCETFHRHGAFARFWSHRHLAPTLIPSLKTRPLPSNCPLIWWGPKGPKNCPHFSSRMIIFGTQCVATTRTHTHTHTEVWATQPLSLHGCLLWKQHQSSLPPPPWCLLPSLWTPAWHTRPCSLAHIFTRRY